MLKVIYIIILYSLIQVNISYNHTTAVMVAEFVHLHA
jgi:hypothetical protein